MLKTAIGRFRFVAILEGISFLLIGITMILKYNYAIPKPNYIVGMGHGILFILYVVLMIQVAYVFKWKFKTVFIAFAASLIPFGTFIADKYVFSKYAKTT